MDVGHGEIYLYFKKMAFDLILYYDVKNKKILKHLCI